MRILGKGWRLLGFRLWFGFGFGFGKDRWVDEAFGGGCIAGTRCVLFVPFVGGGTAQIVDGLNWWLVVADEQ